MNCITCQFEKLQPALTVQTIFSWFALPGSPLTSCGGYVGAVRIKYTILWLKADCAN